MGSLASEAPRRALFDMGQGRLPGHVAVDGRWRLRTTRGVAYRRRGEVDFSIIKKMLRAAMAEMN
jgi:hypothetical protein